MSFRKTFVWSAALVLSLAGTSRAEAYCEVGTNAQVSISYAGFGNVLFGQFPIRVSGTPSTFTARSTNNCSGASYTTRLYINNSYLSSSSNYLLNTANYPDGDYSLRADISDGYSSGTTTQIIRIRNAWVNPAVFQADVYVQLNPDLSGAYQGQGAQPAYATQHWVYYGINEGRQASRSFHSREYLANYSDLRSAFGENFSAAVEHYVRNGISERREGLLNATGQVQPAGAFQINRGGGIYISNGSDAYCGVASWDDYLIYNPSGDTAGVRNRNDAPPMRDDGPCRIAQPVGFFQLNSGIYYSNGADAFCSFDSWEKYLSASGGNADTSGLRSRTTLPIMHNHGVCR